LKNKNEFGGEGEESFLKNGDTRTGFLPPPLYLSDFLAPIFEGKKKATVQQPLFFG